MKTNMLVFCAGLTFALVLGAVATVNALAPQIGGSDTVVRKYDSETNEIRTLQPGSSGNDDLPGVAISPGVLYVAGRVWGGSAFSGRVGSGNDDGFVAKLTVNRPPVANAGDNLLIGSGEQFVTVLSGAASDADNDPLTYRWLEGTIELGAGQVGPDGIVPLNLGAVYPLSLGAHTIILEVNDGYGTNSDSMTLTVENSSPTAAPFGDGIFRANTPVRLGGQVADYDGDLLTYRWLEEGVVLASGTVQTIVGGTPVILPRLVLSDLTVGTHTLALEADDGTNVPTTQVIIVDIIDPVAPTLAPVADRAILWPPNHKMVPVTIVTNGSDNSGTPVTLQAAVLCNEFEEGATYWTEPVIDQTTGTVSLFLLAERFGKGTGRRYTVIIIATDAAENSSSAGVQIIVPHDRGKK